MGCVCTHIHTYKSHSFYYIPSNTSRYWEGLCAQNLGICKVIFFAGISIHVFWDFWLSDLLLSWPWVGFFPVDVSELCLTCTYRNSELSTASVFIMDPKWWKFTFNYSIEHHTYTIASAELLQFHGVWVLPFHPPLKNVKPFIQRMTVLSWGFPNWQLLTCHNTWHLCRSHSIVCVFI